MRSRPGKAFRVASGAACLAAGVVLSAPSAGASSGPAQAGLFAPANDAVSANRNPAGLTRVQRPEWVLQGLYFRSDSRFRQKSSDGEASIDNNDGSTFIPFVYYARPLTERLGFG
ncbi:MAG: outer membrane protein transport protein, partial [Myxococcota bacterium]